MQYNLLTESVIYNDIPLSGTLRELNTYEIEALVNGTQDIITSSGQEIALILDLGLRKSIAKFIYNFSPIDISYIKVQYGAALDSLSSGTLNLISSGIEVVPSGYPRYFVFNHFINTVLTSTGHHIQVINTEDEINFGASGNLSSISVTSNELGGYSEVTELKVFNNNSIATNIYVSIDPSSTTKEIIENLELAPTLTGNFSFANTELSVPSMIPWEWGLFSKASIDRSNRLKIDDADLGYPSLELGDRRNLSLSDYVRNTPIDLVFSGTSYIAIADDFNRIILTDPIQNIRIIGSAPTPAPINNNYRWGQCLAWDENNRIYYMKNTTSGGIYYYNLDNGTHNLLQSTSFHVRGSRPLAYNDGYLYIGGALSGTSFEDSYGTQFWKVNIASGIQTRLADMPSSTYFTTAFSIIDEGLYYARSGGFYKYDLSLGSWFILDNGPCDHIDKLTEAKTLHRIFGLETDPTFVSKPQVYGYNTQTSSWIGTPLALEFPTGAVGVEGGNACGICSCSNDTLLFGYEYLLSSGIQTAQVQVINPNVPINLPSVVSGTWISPIFRLDTSAEVYSNILLDYLTVSGSSIRFDNNINIDTFEIRGSDESPACDNIIDNFTYLDPTIYISASTDSNSVAIASGNALRFSHNFINSSETPYNSSYVTFGYEFTSVGKMQYKFWWNPASNKQVGNDANYSIFYLVPFIDTLNTGQQPDRNVEHLRRTTDNYLSLRFGQASDSNGNFSVLKFYNGSSTTVYGIQAQTNNFYEVSLIIDWDLGSYSLYFRNKFLGSGVIPQVRLTILKPAHTYEFFSGGQNVDFEEKFSRLTISRVGTVLEETITNAAIPVHIEDPLYGKNGSLPWHPVTVNSAFVPNFKYIQFKLTLSTSGSYFYPVVNEVDFLNVIRCDSVPASGVGSVYLRYKFPPSNSNITNTVRLKAWMQTDKD